MSKYIYSTNTIHYQKARIFRKSSTNKIAYCVEPFRFFEETAFYNESTTIDNLSKEKIDTIKKIAYFGYGYNNHTENKWYAITQYMIWKEVEQGKGEVYFTEGLNGKKIEPYQKEIQEIKDLIAQYDKKINIDGRTVHLIENRSNNIYVGKELSNYNIISNEFKIKGEYLIPQEKIKEGDYTISLTRKEENYETPIIFYQSTNSQNLMEIGNLEEKIINTNVNVVKTRITINKEDEETNIKPQGKASLDGAIIIIYNEFNNLIGEYEIKNNKVVLEDLDIGKYYIEEKSPGEGYNLNPNRYEITLSLEEAKKEITIKNKVISKKIKIIKEYGESNNFLKEKNIEFNIYDDNNNYIKTITTNEKGEVEVILPYGKYSFVQMTTTEGYNKIEPFEILVENENTETIKLKDYRIIVPDTSSYKPNYIKKILSFLIKILCIKKYL